MTHMSKKSRRKSINKLNAQNDKLICKVFLPSMHEIDIRNITRLKQIPLDVYEKMMLSFYPPDEVEFNEIEWFI